MIGEVFTVSHIIPCYPPYNWVHKDGYTVWPGLMITICGVTESVVYFTLPGEKQERFNWHIPRACFEEHKMTKRDYDLSFLTGLHADLCDE